MMSHHITSGGTDALQMLRAQQAFRARTAGPASREVDEVLLSHVAEAASVEAPAEKATSASRQPDPRQDLYREVQDLAGRLGYVGLSETAIQRAMTLGESLLADYRV